MISLTSRSPPASLLTRLGLRFRSSCALSSFPLKRPGLDGIAAVGLVGESLAEPVPPEGAGISNHSSPEMSSFFKKNGHSLINIEMDSLASDVEIGTGEDLTTALMTSWAGRARLFLAGVELPTGGTEKSLNQWKGQIREAERM